MGGGDNLDDRWKSIRQTLQLTGLQKDKRGGRGRAAPHPHQLRVLLPRRPEEGPRPNKRPRSLGSDGAVAVNLICGRMNATISVRTAWKRSILPH